MGRLHKAMVTAAIIGALLAAGAGLWPTIAEAAQAPPASERHSPTAAQVLRAESALEVEAAPETGKRRAGPGPIASDTDRRAFTSRPASSERAERWTAPVGAIDPATRFDPPPLPWLPGHRGVDLASSTGHPVAAAGPGTVVFAGELAGRGVVSIDHADGLRTTYEPLDPIVDRGDTVAAGQVIGHLAPGHASCPVAACLHLGLKQGPDYLDPLLLFGSGQVRLLPRPGEDTS